MDCSRVDLVAYHLGSDTDDERGIVEEHLVACGTCLRTYLALKRATDRAQALERPRPEVRARLRADVMRAFPARPRARPLGKAARVFAWRIPLYQGVALAAVAAAIAIAAPTVVERITRGATPAGTADVDTSRTHAESLHIY